MCQMTNAAENLLASPEDLIVLLTQFGETYPRRSTQRRSDEDLARAAMFNLFQSVVLPEDLPNQAATQRVTAPPVVRGGAAGVSLNATAEKKKPVSRLARRSVCRCGKCQSCLDNARWERIFNEKFADPTYYGPLTVRHNSCLAGPR